MNRRRFFNIILKLIINIQIKKFLQLHVDGGDLVNVSLIF